MLNSAASGDFKSSERIEPPLPSVRPILHLPLYLVDTTHMYPVAPTIRTLFAVVGDAMLNSIQKEIPFSKLFLARSEDTNLFRH